MILCNAIECMTMSVHSCTAIVYSNVGFMYHKNRYWYQLIQYFRIYLQCQIGYN